MTRFITRESFVVFIFALVLASASSVFAVWSDPTDVPPNANTPAPLNTSATTQTKTGGLWTASMGTDNGYCIGVDCITGWSDIISTGAVTTNTIANSAVTVAKIADGAVTAAKTDFVGTLQEGQWCTVSGGDIVCASDAPSVGSVSGTVVGGGVRSASNCSAGSGGGYSYSCNIYWGSATCSGSQVACPAGTTRQQVSYSSTSCSNATYYLCITN